MLVVIGILIKILLVVGISQGAVAYLIYVERKVAAYAQDRIGPNRAGREFGIPFGLLQPLADGAKMLLKEDVVPAYVTKPLYLLAPMIAIVAAMIGFAVVPFGPVASGPSPASHRLPDRPVHGRRHRLRLRDRQPGGLRRDPGGLGLQQQVFVHRRPAVERPVDQLRDPAGPLDPGHRPAGRLARPERRSSSGRIGTSGGSSPRRSAS